MLKLFIQFFFKLELITFIKQKLKKLSQNNENEEYD